MKMSKLTAAYIAGFVDGDGYISVYPFIRKDRNNQVYYKPTFKVANTNKKIIEWFKSSFGGYIYTRIPNNKIDKISYIWSLDSKTLEEVLKLICPYLRIKKPQCELVLERIRIGKRRQVSGVYYSSDKTWRTYIHQNGKQQYIGLFNSEEEAKKAFLKAKQEKIPEFDFRKSDDDKRVEEIYFELRKLNKRGNPLYVERLSEVTSNKDEAIV